MWEDQKRKHYAGVRRKVNAALRVQAENDADTRTLAREATAQAAFYIEQNSALVLGEEGRAALTEAVLRILNGERS